MQFLTVQIPPTCDIYIRSIFVKQSGNILFFMHAPNALHQAEFFAKLYKDMTPHCETEHELIIAFNFEPKRRLHFKHAPNIIFQTSVFTPPQRQGERKTTQRESIWTSFEYLASLAFMTVISKTFYFFFLSGRKNGPEFRDVSVMKWWIKRTSVSFLDRVIVGFICLQPFLKENYQSRKAKYFISFH